MKGAEEPKPVEKEKFDLKKHGFLASWVKANNPAGGEFNLAPYIHLHFDALFEWPSLGHVFVSDKGRCYGMKSMCGVLVDGTVVPCCLDSKGDIALGNIFTQSMDEILQSNRTQQMLKGLQSQKLVEPLCQRCGYRRRFS
jgi:radical SAM protein with 4Fe4S-binding SPASM domain